MAGRLWPMKLQQSAKDLCQLPVLQRKNRRVRARVGGFGLRPKNEDYDGEPNPEPGGWVDSHAKPGCKAGPFKKRAWHLSSTLPTKGAPGAWIEQKVSAKIRQKEAHPCRHPRSSQRTQLDEWLFTWHWIRFRSRSHAERGSWADGAFVARCGSQRHFACPSTGSSPEGAAPR